MPDTGPPSFDELLQSRWTALASRLGERRDALLHSVTEKAAQHGFAQGAEAARFANLCFAHGPGFETKPENEWALAILLDERLAPWVKLHQLVVQSLAVLRRRGGESLAQAERLLGNDQWLLDRCDEPARPAGSRPLRRAPLRVRRVACDVEAAELRLLDTAFRQEYRFQAGQWQRVAVDSPAPVRIDANHPPPERLTVLSRPSTLGPPVRLQLRSVMHGRCGLGQHPSVQWQPARGGDRWQDEAARAPAWPVAAEPDPTPPRLFDEAPPSIARVTLASCGLRDQGVPLGDVEVEVLVYDARQRLVQTDREARMGFVLPDPKSNPPAVRPTRVSFESDGQAIAAPALAWQKGFDEQLRAALADGLQQLHKAWAEKVHEPTLHAEVGLFDGQASLTWGLREGPRALASPPLLRVSAQLDLAASASIELGGQVEYAGARARIGLRVEGQARLQASVERLFADVELIAAMEPAQLRWRWPVTVDFDPLSADGSTLFAELGPCTGAITGQLSLRPSTRHGGAWEWHAMLMLEPVSSRVVVHDAVLGRSDSHLALLGSAVLLDWSLA